MIELTHLLQATFIRIQNQVIKKKNAAISLKFPVKTRWGSYLHCLLSLKANKFVLQILSIWEAQLPSELKKKKASRDDDVFWVCVEKMICILDSIVNLISYLEPNEPQIHLVNRKFNNLENVLLEVGLCNTLVHRKILV